ncbi:MAG: hypothetical protein ABJB05_07670 [Parafilimonas sp.]
MKREFSKKELEANVENTVNKLNEFWESERGKKMLQRLQLTIPKPELERMNRAATPLKNFLSNVEESTLEREKECKLILDSMHAYAEQNGLIKPMDDDEFIGFYLSNCNTDDLINKWPDRSLYIAFDNYMKKEIEKQVHDNTGKTLQTLYDAEQLKNLRKALITRNYIDEIKENDFIHLLSYKAVNEARKMKWKKSKSEAVYLLDCICIDLKFSTANKCIETNLKGLDSNNRKGKYNDIDNILKTLRPI